MPLFDFECKECSALFEELVFSDDELPPCQECQSKNTIRRVAAPSPLKTNPFPYPRKPGEKAPKMATPAQMAKVNRTCPNAASCSASVNIGGASGG